MDAYLLVQGTKQFTLKLPKTCLQIASLTQFCSLLVDEVPQELFTVITVLISEESRWTCLGFESVGSREDPSHLD